MANKGINSETSILYRPYISGIEQLEAKISWAYHEIQIRYKCRVLTWLIATWQHQPGSDLGSGSAQSYYLMVAHPRTIFGNQ